MRRSSLGEKIVLGFSLALLMLIMLSVAAYRNIRVFTETNYWVERSEKALGMLEKAQMQAEDAEVERGYLLTGDEAFLAPYRDAKNALPSTLEQLQHLITDSPSQRQRLAALAPLITQRLAFAQAIIEARRVSGPQAAIDMFQSGQGKALLEKIDAIIDALRSEEVELLQQRRSAADRSARATLRMIIVSDVLAFLCVALAGAAIGRDLTKRKSTERALLQAHTELEQRVAERTAALSQANEELRREVAERERAEEALAQRTVELQRSNDELQQFASVASHDLQEPLRTVASFARLLADRYRGKLDADADEFIGFIVDGTTRMQAMVQDLLIYARVSSRGQKFIATDSHAVLDSVLHDLQHAISESDATVTTDPLPTVLADEHQLRQLFQNLIGNALKYRGLEPPRIHMSARRDSSQWVFSVQDNGIGIDPQHAERIFVIFQRLHTRSEYPGTGIGLAICKKIVERHGGRIWVESTPGKGSTFFFTLKESKLLAESEAPWTSTRRASVR